MSDDAVVVAMKDRSKPAQAPEMFKPSGRWTSHDALVNEFKARRDANIKWLWETRDDLRGKFVKFGGRPVDVYQMLLAIPAHNERHLQQIAEIKASPNYPKN